jgi:hypothetical protein
MRRRLLLAAAILGLAGCQAPLSGPAGAGASARCIAVPAQPPARTQEAGRRLAALMRYAATVSKWPEDQRELELQRLASQGGGKADEGLRLRQAVLLLLSHGSAVRQQRARTLLKQVARAPQPGEEAALADLLLSVQGPPRVTERDEIDKLRHELANERSERESLQHKLEELKNIEKSMNERKPSESLPLEDVRKAKNSAGR